MKSLMQKIMVQPLDFFLSCLTGELKAKTPVLITGAVDEFSYFPFWDAILAKGMDGMKYLKEFFVQLSHI